MNYKIDIYKNNEDNKHRYALGIRGNNPLIVIGLNPSTADEVKPDATIRKVMGIAKEAKKDGFIMLNLYPQRATYPKDLEKDFNEESHSQNLKFISSVLSEFSNIDILLGYGNNIQTRYYLKKCLKDIMIVANKFNPRWFKTGDVTKYGHPRHPLYVAYSEGLTSFDIVDYIDKLNMSK